ncbi:FAD binding domain-containing protein [Amycolatopsis methanolica]|uniref:Molybdopterin dehydrogenase FAD-binding protein n=1 Tax=Amycolatopsis methanolica 239 TaxID=1068978 RepID=A0A076N5N8_AMYME|nr:FAD binding domain-containing protein [Amycolatopsis methanolica]AIJ26130.1 molybdopterin dehydrogenase FAD-binding protein [Amycolatopsis methanolica 239]
MKPAAFAYEAPGTAAEAVDLLARHGEDAKFLAGGQSLLPLLGLRLAAPTALIDLNGVTELAHHRHTPDELVVGALCRHRDIELDPRVAARSPMIAEAVRHIGHVAIRNRGTVGGSLVHADPSAEWTVLAMLLDATFVILGPSGARTLGAAEFFDGFLATTLEPGELLTEVRFPLASPTTGTAFVELARRHGDFAIASAAAALETDGDGRITSARLAASGAAPAVVRLTAAEEALRGRPVGEAAFAEAADAAVEAAEPTPDLHGDAEYRRRLVGVIVRRALTRAAERIEDNS